MLSDLQIGTKTERMSRVIRKRRFFHTGLAQNLVKPSKPSSPTNQKRCKLPINYRPFAILNSATEKARTFGFLSADEVQT